MDSLGPGMRAGSDDGMTLDLRFKGGGKQLSEGFRGRRLGLGHFRQSSVQLLSVYCATCWARSFQYIISLSLPKLHEVGVLLFPLDSWAS